MREIKFRAWDVKSNMYVIASHVMNIHTGQISDLPERFILEQFTGLHDKNGKEIYEGDILESKRQYKYLYNAGYRGHIVSREHYADYEYGMFGGQITQAKSKHCEVIGNIHENPELLNANP